MRWMARHWPELIAMAFFAALTAAALLLTLVCPSLATGRSAAALNAGLSIGTGGIVSFLFYYLVNARLEYRRRALLRTGVEGVYRAAKWNIAQAVIQASCKGGRTDLALDLATIERALSISGFKSLFPRGREADEGFYAFENQMSSRTPEFEEIVFNLELIAQAADRLINNDGVDDPRAYDFFIRLSTLVQRIKRNGAGYDESKLLCEFIWEIFAGWNSIDGDVGYDPINRAILHL